MYVGTVGKFIQCQPILSKVHFTVQRSRKSGSALLRCNTRGVQRAGWQCMVDCAKGWQCMAGWMQLAAMRAHFPG